MNTTISAQEKYQLELDQNITDWKQSIVNLAEASQKKDNSTAKQVPPNQHLKEIFQNGKVNLKFDSDVFTVSDFKFLKNGTIILNDDVPIGRILKRRASLIS